MAERVHITPDMAFQERLGYVHRLVITDKKGVGYSEFMFASDPLPFYYVFFVFVPQRLRGNGLGSIVLNETNQFLLERGRAGVLRNEIHPDLPTHQMYVKHGWLPVDQEWLVYNVNNLPDHAIDRIVIRAMELENSDGPLMRPNNTSGFVFQSPNRI